jgi:RNA polymerase sigma factor (sigma-70 family)
VSPDAQILAVDVLGEHAIRPRPAHPEVKALTTAIASGDTEAFCLDVVQDAMLRIIRRMKPMATERDLSRWLRAVVQSCAYDRLRGESRRRRREAEAAAGRREPGTRTATDRGDLRERLQWLEQQLRTCDDASVRLLLMRHRFGWTLQQIGVALGIKPGAVDGRLRRLVGGLRRTAREEFDD